jgi:small subunit ribosomal protein S1
MLNFNNLDLRQPAQLAREKNMQKVKKRFVPQFTNIAETNEDFQQLLDSVSTTHVKEGMVVKGQVVGVGKDVIVVDVGLKNEGRIPIEEFTVSKTQALPEVGEVVDVFIEKIEGKNGRTILSREKAVREESWARLEISHAKGEFVNGTIFGRVKGGFTVDISGVVAFLPGSQVDVRPIKDTSSIMNIEQPFLILKMDKKLGNIVVSRRAILEESRSEARDEMLSKIKEGEIYDGIVKNITDYGAFVDLGSVDGLLHVTDISWSRINHPSEVLSIGQRIKVMVIKYNEETKRISLGMKQLDNNPWQGIQDEFPVGKIMMGKVTNIADYGVFIELKDGIEGLVHSTEISWLKANQNPKKSLTIGQEVKFIILELDTEKHRISLSIKQCQENPLKAFSEKNQIGDIIKAPIRNITDFGMFVALSENLDGMIHENDISWEGNGSTMLKTYKKGDEVECKVLAIDIEKERISLSIKQLSGNQNQAPTTSGDDNLKKNMSMTCSVIAIKDDGIEVRINDTTNGFIKKVDLSSEKSDQKTERFAVGDRVDAKIISIDKQNKVTLSIKALEVDEREKAIKEYGSTDSGARLGDILGAALGESKKSK